MIKQPEKNVIDFDNVIAASAHSSYDDMLCYKDAYSYVKHLGLSFMRLCESGQENVTYYGEETSAEKAARLCGALILGVQAFEDSRDFISICDECDADLYEMAEELESVMRSLNCNEIYENVLYIHSLELSESLVDAPNLSVFFDRILRHVFHATNVMPTIICNLIASTEGYYETAVASTSFDPRSVGRDSIRFFINDGFNVSESGMLLYRFLNADGLPFEADSLYPPTAKIAEIENDGMESPQEEIGERLGAARNNFQSECCDAFDPDIRHVLEDPSSIGFGPDTVLISRPASKKLKQCVQAAIGASRTGLRFKRMLDIVNDMSDDEGSQLFVLYQKLYFECTAFMNETKGRMLKEVIPTSGEHFAEAALL